MAREHSKRTPDEVEGLIWEGKALRKLKRLDEAEKVLLKGLETDAEDPDLAEELIFTLAQAGKDAEAMKRADTLAAEDPHRARFLRAFVHVSAGRPGKAVEELKAMLEADPESVDDLEKESAFEKLRQEVDLQILIGRAKAGREYKAAAGELLGSQEWEGLLKLAKERVGAAPDHAEAHYHQGYALRRLGKPFDAELAIKAAIAKTKDKTIFRDELAKALAAQGKREEALAAADEIEAADKFEGMYLRVVVHAMMKNSEPALKALAALLKEDPAHYIRVEADADLEELRKLSACQALLKKAKAADE
jgi:tetratricopeptide (TPR) repeat protein